MPATSEKVRYWIDMALECVRRDHTSKFGAGDQKGPFLTARALGMALAALHDAYVDPNERLIVDKNFPLPKDGFSRDISGCAACQQLLKLRYPQQAVGLNAAWDFWGEYHEIGVDVVSEDYGRRIAGQIDLLGIDDRQFGGSVTYKNYTPYSPGGAYTHQADPNEPGQGFAGSLWGNVKTIISGAINDFAPPPGRDKVNVKPDKNFSEDFLHVQTKGANQKRSRTAKEEVIGIFWGYDGASELGTPPRLYMQVVLQILDEIEARTPAKLTDQDELKIVAAVGLAMADAGVEAWRYKYSPEHMMWRPVHGIRHGLGGVFAPAEVGWNPLGKPITNDPRDTTKFRESVTPDFPAYPSGHATFGAAAFQLLRLFLAEKKLLKFDENGVDSLSFCAHSDEYNGRNFDQNSRVIPRSKLVLNYKSLWAAIIDNSVSRVYLGVHWQFDGLTKVGDEDPLGVFGVPKSPAELGRRGGVWLGCQIANAIAGKINITDAVINASGIPLPAPVAVGGP
ncbi:phosphatase PAP2 family protein [uncultured Sphaerotilus sp.]|uniref:vanadium-dependent haloperoxidase n=1 Tax=uncultured Sphaerotilus sp. TaxID=474984 RepID=UPI0030CA3881